MPSGSDSRTLLRTEETRISYNRTYTKSQDFMQLRLYEKKKNDPKEGETNMPITVLICCGCGKPCGKHAVELEPDMWLCEECREALEDSKRMQEFPLDWTTPSVKEG